MLQLIIPSVEFYDEIKEEFVNTKEQIIQVEHSLVSISKWESKWNKPFLNKETKTIEETLDYIKCMTLTQNVKEEVYSRLTNDNIDLVSKYIAEPMSATWFNDDSKKGSGEIITSEVIYYWMITYNIPFECQKWHLNRLLTLIRVCSMKNEKPKKMSRSELINSNKALNEQRKRQLNSKG
jgi:hypothetical protein